MANKDQPLRRADFQGAMMVDDRSDLGILIMISAINDVGIGGTRRYVINLCDALKLRGIRTLVIYNAKDEFYSLLNDDGKDVRFVAFPRPHISNRWHPRERRRIQAEIGRIVKEANISIIHLQNAYMFDYIDRSWGLPVYCPQISGFAPIGSEPKRMTWWDSSLFFRFHPVRLANSWYRKYVAYNYNRADLVVNLSGAAQETSEIFFRVKKSKSIIVPQGTQPASPTADGKKIRTELGIHDDVKMVIGGTRLTKSKGVEDFGEIAKRLNREDGRFRFCFIGHDRGNHAYRDELLERYGEFVEFLGYRGDMPDIYAAADLMLHTSPIEGGPYFVIEAMAYGIPSVTWDVPGPSTIIQHDVNGLLIPFGDLDGMADAVRNCLEDDALYARLSEGALLRYPDYSLESYADNMIAVYDRLLAETNTNR